MIFPKFNEYNNFNIQELNKINPLFAQAFEKFIFGLRLLNKLTESWNKISPKIASRNATFDHLKIYKELTNQFDGSTAACLFAFIREKVPKNGTFGKEYVNSQAGMQILSQFGWTDMYRQDLANLIKNDFLSTFNQIIIYTSYVIQRQFSNLSQKEDSNYQLIEILPKFESNFEKIYSDLADQIVKEKDPYVAHDISFGHKGRIHKKSELLYQCKPDDEDTGNQYIRRITINYDDPVTIYDIFNVYRDFYGCLYEFIEEGEKTCKLIQIFNEYYEKPTKIYKEYIDKNFKFCMSVIQKVIPMYTTESESHNFLIEIEKVCLTKEHKEILNKTKNFFNTAHVEADKKRKEIRKNDDHNRDLSKIEPKLNDVRRYIDELKSASKSDNYYQYEQARDRLRSQIPVLEKYEMKETAELIKKVEETLSETSKEENRFKIISFYNDHFHSINSIMNLLKEAIDNKDANLITPYKNSLKEQLKNLDNDIKNKFDGDSELLMKFEPMKNMIENANSMLNVKIDGKSAECLQAEKIYLVQINGYLPSIDMMCNVPPNKNLSQSLSMMKSQLNNIAENLMPFKDESSEIKEALEKSNEAIKKLDLQISKCDQL